MLRKEPHLGVVVRNGWRVDYKSGLRIAEPLADERNVVGVVYVGPFAFEFFGQRRAGEVVAGHAAAFVHEKASQCAHAYAAYAQKVYVFVHHRFSFLQSDIFSILSCDPVCRIGYRKLRDMVR